jgi:hypothetical protein
MSLPALQNDSNVPSSKLYNGGNWWGNAILVHRSGASDGSADGIWGLSADQIKYDSANDIWVDLADGQPSKISDTWDVDTTAVTGSSTSANPVEVFLWNNNGGQFLGKFANPFYSSGGTITLSVVPTQFTQSVPSGVTSVTHPGDLGRQLYYTIAKARSSGTYNIHLDDVFHISVTHTNGTVSSGQVAGEQYAQNYKLYFGQVFESPSLNTLVTEFTWQSMSKKVHSNFW